MRLFLAAIVSLALVACGGSDKDQPKQPDNASGSPGVTATASSSSTAASTPGSTAASTPGSTPASTPAGNTSARTELPSLSGVVDKVRPATVQVTNETAVSFGQGGTSLDVPQGTGTGFIYDKEGHVLTNAHVVAGGTTLLVTLANGDAQPAKLIGSDPRTDVAVLQLSGSSLPTVALGDATKVKVGDWTVAIGHALGLPGGPTVTAGVLSAMGRHVQEPSDTGGAGPFLFDMLQTDAPINPGNSGGPLVNLNGEVIGMNTLVAGQAGEGQPAQGIGFAISINRAKSIADLLVKDGKVAHSVLGVSFVPLNPATALQLGTKPDTKGAAIGQVAPGSPASKAGLRARDIVTKVDGTPVKEESDLPRLIDQKKPGENVKLTVLRDNAEQNVDVTLDQAS